MHRLALAAAVLCGVGCTDQQSRACPLEEPAALRSPITGLCTVTSGGECSPGCPCPAQSNGPDIAEFGGECTGACTGLDEADCGSNGECHIALLAGGPGSGTTFWACWDIAPMTPTSTGDCAGEDVDSCFIDPACASVYTGDPTAATTDYAGCITAQ